MDVDKDWNTRGAHYQSSFAAKLKKENLNS